MFLCYEAHITMLPKRKHLFKPQRSQRKWNYVFFAKLLVTLVEQLIYGTILLHPVSYRLAFVYKKNSYFNSNLVLSIIHIESKALINLLLLPIITSLIRFNLVRYIELRGYGYSVYFDVFFIFMVLYVLEGDLSLQLVRTFLNTRLLATLSYLSVMVVDQFYV